MFLSTILAAFAALRGRGVPVRAAQPNFEGLLDELYAASPLRQRVPCRERLLAA